MKKFTTIGAALLLGGLGFSAIAQNFPQPTEISPTPGSVLIESNWAITNVNVTWNDILSKVNAEYEWDNEVNVELSINNGESSNIIAYFSVDGYTDPDSYEYVSTGPTTLTIDISNYAYDWSTNSFPIGGEIKITIPAGILQVEDGVENETMVLTYTLVTEVSWDSDEVTPPYVDTTVRSSQLAALTVPFNTTGKLSAADPLPGYITATLVDPNAVPDDPWGGIMPWSLNARASGNYNYGDVVTIDPKLVSFKDNAIVVDASALTDGQWNIVIPQGYAKADNVTYTEEFNVTYEVFNGMPDPVVTPANGSVIYGTPENTVFAWLDNYGVKPVVENAPIQVEVTVGSYTAEIDATYTSQGLVVDWAKVATDTKGEIIPGVYSIKVPNGVLEDEDGEPNVWYEVTYTVYAATAVKEITPDPNDGPVSASELGAVTVTFNDNIQAVADPSPVKVLLQSNDEDDAFGQDVETQAEGSPVAANGDLDPEYVKVVNNSIVLDLSFLNNGAWYIEIPGGYAQVNGTTYTEKVVIEYTVGDDWQTAEVIFGLNNLYYTSQALPQYAELTWSYNALELTGEGTITLQTADGTIDVKAEDVKLEHAVAPVDGNEPGTEGDDILGDSDETLNALTIFNLDSYLEGVTGQVELVIPAGFVLVNGRANDEFSVNVEIYPIFEGEASFLFESATGNVEVTWPGYLASVFNFYQHPAYLTDSTGANQELSYSNAQADDADITEIKNDDNDSVGLSVNLASLKLADGSYTLWIPSTYVVISSVDFEENWLNATEYWQFEVKDGAIVGESTGISAIEGAKVVEGVYNLQGVKMSNDLNTLAPGLYIINGKKVLVRK